MRRSATLPRWSLLFGLAAISLVAGLLVAGFLSLPAVTAIAPAPGAQNVSSRAPIRLTFNHPMARGSVEAAFKLTPAHEGSFSWDSNTLTFTPAQPWPVGQLITVSVAGSTGERGLPLKGRASWAFAVSQPRIAYLAGSISNLWTLGLAEAAQPQQVTSETVGIASYDVSPDGQAFIYAAQRGDGGADLRSINVDGTSAAILQTVSKANSTTALSALPAGQSSGGLSVTFTATVTASAPGSGIPIGSVTFFNNGSSIGVGTYRIFPR